MKDPYIDVDKMINHLCGDSVVKEVFKLYSKVLKINCSFIYRFELSFDSSVSPDFRQYSCVAFRVSDNKECGLVFKGLTGTEALAQMFLVIHSFYIDLLPDND